MSTAFETSNEETAGIRPSHDQVARRSAFVLLAIHACLVGWMGYRMSLTPDEAGHLAAGVSYWHFGTFDLYRVNPPLVRLIASLPAVLGGAATDWTSYTYGGAARPEMRVGLDFVAANKESWFFWFVTGRWACLPLSLLGGYVCYRWADELWGQPSGLMALMMWCFSPGILANAALITADVAAAATGALSGYTFWCWLRRPRWQLACIAGAALGLAQLTKMTWILLFALWPVLWLAWNSRRVEPGRRRLESLQFLGIMGLAVYVLNLGYGFEGTWQPLKDHVFVSRALAGGASVSDGLAGGNRFAGTFLGALPVPFPKHYLEGIDLQRLDFERKMWSYFAGEWKRGGWWYFYLAGLAIKEPLGTWALLACSAVAAVFCRGCSAGWRNTLVLLAPACAVLILVSSQTGFTIHTRYILPALPFVFILAGGAAQRRLLRHRFGSVAVLAAATWSAVSSVSAFPHNLSYANEAAGGPLAGHHYLLDSNYDWGQDLWYLKSWCERNPQAQPLCVECATVMDLARYGIERCNTGEQQVLPETLRQVGDLASLQAVPGWYALSAQCLHDREGRNSAFQSLQPSARAGYSILIFRLSRRICG